jgi:hypothetical protein
VIVRGIVLMSFAVKAAILSSVPSPKARRRALTGTALIGSMALALGALGALPSHATALDSFCLEPEALETSPFRVRGCEVEEQASEEEVLERARENARLKRLEAESLSQPVTTLDVHTKIQWATRSVEFKISTPSYRAAVVLVIRHGRWSHTSRGRQGPVAGVEETRLPCTGGTYTYTVTAQTNVGPALEKRGRFRNPFTLSNCSGPGIADLHWHQEGVGPPGAGYWVRETITLRACATQGTLRILVTEQKRAGNGCVEAEGFHTFRVGQNEPCQLHSVSWRLSERLFGIGEYRLRTAVADWHGRESRPEYRSATTTD